MSTARFDTLSNAAGTSTVPVNTVVNGSAKAWVNFNGTGTVAIRAAFNVSSITDNGTGDYTVNFTTALPDANYSTVVSSGAVSSSTWSYAQSTVVGIKSTGDFIGTYSTSAVSVVLAVGSTPTDRNLLCVSIFR